MFANQEQNGPYSGGPCFVRVSVEPLFRESDKQEAVVARIERYNECLSKVLDDLAERQPVFINADQDPDIVYQLVESKLSKPLQTKDFY